MIEDVECIDPREMTGLCISMLVLEPELLDEYMLIENNVARRE